MAVVTEEKRGPVTILTINRPEKRNAISKQVALDLQRAFLDFSASEQRVAIVTGAGGKAFSSGADITDLPELWRCIPGVGFRTEKPIIAAIPGWCVGGALVLAMMSDLLIAAESAQFSYPEGKVGITGGMIAGLAARIPHKIAMELMLLGNAISARRAYEVGLANRIVPDAELLDAAVAMGTEIAGFAPLAIGTMKRFVDEHIMPRGPSELAARFGAELAAVKNSEDAAEGGRAFREKRAPKYTGR